MRSVYKEREDYIQRYFFNSFIMANTLVYGGINISVYVVHKKHFYKIF